MGLMEFVLLRSNITASSEKKKSKLEIAHKTFFLVDISHNAWLTERRIHTIFLQPPFDVSFCAFFHTTFWRVLPSSPSWVSVTSSWSLLKLPETMHNLQIKIKDFRRPSGDYVYMHTRQATFWPWKESKKTFFSSFSLDNLSIRPFFHMDSEGAGWLGLCLKA